MTCGKAPAKALGLCTVLCLQPARIRQGAAGRGAGAGNVEPGLLCSKPAVAVNYMHAPKWSDQAATLEQYWPSASTEGRLPVVVLSVGFWEKSAEVPEVRDPLHCCMFFTYLQPLSLYLRRLWVPQSHKINYYIHIFVCRWFACFVLATPPLACENLSPC